ncbi:hypothetical protein [Limnohabitans sp. DM1]|uniref:hypothetical protein n=1 Tax=Limnohabitans sp. DM1 TaxID=1597955 RepID=UPI000B2B87BA|nr:hypothetical protein [Limnohabitans sp. DM1]
MNIGKLSRRWDTGAVDWSTAWANWQKQALLMLRPWVWGLGSALLGACAVVLVHLDVTQAYTQADEAVERLRQQTAALAPPSPLKAEDAEHAQRDALSRLPGQAQPSRIWLDLQQALSQQGLRVMVLRPVSPQVQRITPGRSAPAASTGSPVPSQAVTLRVIGAFARWVKAWAAFTEAGPVWSIDRISIVAQPDSQDVQIDAVLRVWMRPGESTWQAWPAHDGSVDGPPDGARALPNQVSVQAAPLFAQPAPLLAQAGAAGSGSETGSGDTAQPAASTAPDLPEDPERWPLARVRLAGVWQQGADRQAVLVAGPHWARVRPGQRVTLEGHRVQAITSEGVTLRAARGPVHVLHWEGGK